MNAEEWEAVKTEQLIQYYQSEKGILSLAFLQVKKQKIEY